jgi:hypothetical protein
VLQSYVVAASVEAEIQITAITMAGPQNGKGLSQRRAWTSARLAITMNVIHSSRGHASVPAPTASPKTYRLSNTGALSVCPRSGYQTDHWRLRVLQDKSRRHPLRSANKDPFRTRTCSGVDLQLLPATYPPCQRLPCASLCVSTPL